MHHTSLHDGDRDRDGVATHWAPKAVENRLSGLELSRNSPKGQKRKEAVYRYEIIWLDSAGRPVVVCVRRAQGGLMVYVALCFALGEGKVAAGPGHASAPAVRPTHRSLAPLDFP